MKFKFVLENQYRILFLERIYASTVLLTKHIHTRATSKTTTIIESTKLSNSHLEPVSASGKTTRNESFHMRLECYLTPVSCWLAQNNCRFLPSSEQSAHLSWVIKCGFTHWLSSSLLCRIVRCSCTALTQIPHNIKQWKLQVVCQLPVKWFQGQCFYLNCNLVFFLSLFLSLSQTIPTTMAYAAWGSILTTVRWPINTFRFHAIVCFIHVHVDYNTKCLCHWRFRRFGIFLSFHCG